MALAQRGVKMGRFRVRRLMRANGLRLWRPICLTDNSTWRNRIRPGRRTSPIRTGQGELYLTVVVDLYARKIVGWAMAPTTPTELVALALQMAIDLDGLKKLLFLPDLL